MLKFVYVFSNFVNWSLHCYKNNILLFLLLHFLPPFLYRSKSSSSTKTRLYNTCASIKRHFAFIQIHLYKQFCSKTVFWHFTWTGAHKGIRIILRHKSTHTHTEKERVTQKYAKEASKNLTKLNQNSTVAFSLLFCCGFPYYILCICMLFHH